jgi:FAD/FMN-containing dehydrogenase
VSGELGPEGARPPGRSTRRPRRSVSPNQLDTSFLSGVLEVLGAQNVVVDPDVVAPYCSDWTGRFHGRTPAVLRPGSTEEIAAIVDLSRRFATPLVFQGGNTGLAGGAVPLVGEVVVSLGRLKLLDVDADAGQATVGAGVPLAQVQAAAVAAGWSYGVDFASRDSATVGGSIATNAGGIRFLRYGDTRAQLLGVCAVLGTSRVVSHLGGLLKDNTGYNLPGLLCGSEGTLGVVTAARLRLVPQTPQRAVALIGFTGADDAIGGAAMLRRAIGSLEAAELFFDRGLELVCSAFGLPDPLRTRCAAYLVVEAADRIDPTPALAEAVDSLAGVGAVAVAESRARADELWRYREAHTDAINRRGVPHKLDVSLPANALAAFVESVPSVVTDTAPDAEVFLFGHAADGNIHVNVLGVAPDDERVDDAVVLLVTKLGGSISAEHGIGTAKRRWLHLNRSEDEIATFKTLKRALDPDGVLNPSVLFGG